jgi:hypothetical protein
MPDQKEAAKVSGSALLEEMRKQSLLLNEINNNILRLVKSQSSRPVAVTPTSANQAQQNLSLKEQIERYRQANQPPPQQQPAVNPQQMAATQQARSMYPSMSGPSHGNDNYNGDRISGVAEPAWMDQLTPIDKSRVQG